MTIDSVPDSVPVSALVVLCLTILAPTRSHAAPPTGVYQRFAVIGTPTLQKMGLTDLISIELQQTGVTLVERDQLDLITKQQAIGIMLGTGAARDRAQVGRLTKADALILLSEEGDKNQRIRVIIAECKQGARLSSDVFSLDKPGIDLVQKIAAAINRTRTRFAGGIKVMIGVPPFLCRNFTYVYHPLESGYAALLQEALSDQPGVAVVEVEEAHAIRKELDIGGGRALGLVPTFIEGEYEVTTTSPDGKPRVRFKIEILGAQATQTIERNDLMLDDAANFVARVLPGQVLPNARLTVKEASTPAAEFARLVARADEFVALGEWKHALQLRQAALVLDPESEPQRTRIVDECMFAFAALTESFSSEGHQRLAIERLPIWKLALDNLEWEVRRNGSKVRVDRVRNLIDAGVIFASESSVAEESQRIKRAYLLDLFPLVWKPEWKAHGKDGSLDGSDFWADSLLNTAIFQNATKLQEEDYDLILKLLNDVIPADLEPAPALIRLLWEPRFQFMRQSQSFVAFLRKLHDSPRPANRMLSEVAVLSWQVDRRIPLDAAAVRQIDSLRSQYVALKLVPSSVPHKSLLDELERIRTLADPSSIPAVGAPVHAADVLRAGAVTLERVAIRQYLIGHEDAASTANFRGVLTCLPCNASADVLWDATCISVMRKLGELEIIVDGALKLYFLDVQWDGSHLWVAVNNGEIRVYELSGKLVATIGEADGYPPCRDACRLLALATDSVVVAGALGGGVDRSMIAMIEKKENGYRAKVLRTFTRVVELRPGAMGKIDSDVNLAFRPDAVSRFQSPGGKYDTVMIQRFGPIGHYLQLDVRTGEVIAPQTPLQIASFSSVGGWILDVSQRDAVTFWNFSSAGEFSPRGTFSLARQRSFPGAFISPPATRPTEASGLLYMISPAFYRFDLQAMTACRLAAEDSMNIQVSSGMFSHHGLLVCTSYGTRDNGLYRVTIDESKVKALPKSEWFTAAPPGQTVTPRSN